MIDATVEKRGPSLSSDDLAFLVEDHHAEVA